MTRPVLTHIPGNAAAVAQLDAAAGRPVHAYLFVGPPGSGKREAARAFAAALVCPDGGDATCRACRLVLAGEHPDVVEVEPGGNQWLIGDDRNPEPGTARWLVRQSSRSPVEGPRKVFVLSEFHAMNDSARGAMLKTIEEPSPSSVIVGLVDDVPPELITIASRCVPIRFAPLDPAVIEARLVADGTPPDVAAAVAPVAGGDLDRARVLALDPALAERLQRFATVAARLDGSGAAVAREVAALLAAIDAAAEPLKQRQAEELAAVEARATAVGERGSGRRALEARHKREQRRHRTEELRAGLAVLAGTYRDRLVEGSLTHPDRALEAVTVIHEAVQALERNPNEPLLLQSLLLRIPPL